MSATDIVIAVGTGIVGLALGFLFAVLPWKSTEMSEAQNRMQQYLGMLAAGLVLVLILTHKDTASWVVIGAMVVGLAIGKIKPLHAWTLQTFSFFRPSPQPQASRSQAGRQAKAQQAQESQRSHKPHDRPAEQPHKNKPAKSEPKAR